MSAGTAIRLLLVAAVSCASTTTGATQRSAADPRVERVRDRLAAGRYVEAEAEASALVAYARDTHGERSVELLQATGLLVAAMVGTSRGGAESTRALAEETVHAGETILGADHIGLAFSLRNLGNALVRSGDYRPAIAVYRRSITLRERDAGSDGDELAEDLDRLAAALTANGSLDDASKTVARVLEIRGKSSGSNEAGLARALEKQGVLLQRRGDYPRAHEALQRAVAIWERSAPGHPDRASSLSQFGELLRLEGDLRTASTVHLDAVRLAEQLLGPDHPDLANYLRRQALTLANLDEFSAALTLRERALRIAENALGPDNVIVANHVNDLAGAYHLLGDYARARPLYERVLSISAREPGPTDRKATVLYNLGLLNARLGDFLEARRLYERAITTWQQAMGPQHAFVARAQSALAEMLSQQGLDAEARVYYERALAIRRRALGEQHPDVARTLSNLSGTLARLGRTRDARAMSARALEIWQQATPSETTGFAEALVRHAGLQEDQRDHAGARASWTRALDIRQRLLGAGHPATAEAEAGLAGVLAATGETREAFGRALQAETVGREHLRLSLLDLPERQALAYSASRPKGLDLALSLEAGETARAAALYDAVVRNRALVLDEMAARRRITAGTAQAGAQPQWTAVAAARQRLAALVVRGPSDGRSKEYLTAVEEARRGKERAERALAEVSATFRAQRAQEETGFEQVRAALPPRTALVSFVRYDRAVEAGVASYLAFVLVAGQATPSIVHLGAADVVESLVQEWRTRVGSAGAAAERSYRNTAAGLRRQVWDPVAKHLHDAETVYVVPDAALHVVSFAALPVAESGYLGETGPLIHYLVSERDLVTAPDQRSIGTGLFAIGGPAFGSGTAPSAAPQTDCGTLQSLEFRPLPGTRREVDDIARMWQTLAADGVSEGEAARVLSGPAATERAFKQGAPGHRVLHLATHGFFLDGSCQPAAAGTRAVGGLVARRPLLAPVENPLLLSGLALAGANRRAAAAVRDEDGILTAEEVIALNLEGVQWAVLSACDTGLGQTRAGEGVFGLRRAFQIAGARTVIMSLWSVSDEATTSWMRALYRARLERHLNTAEAVRDASRSVLQARRSRGLNTHPFYWAAFVAAGDWR